MSDETTRLAERAYDLIVLLTQYVEVCGLKEDHDGKVIGKRYANLKAETVAYKALEEEDILPLLVRCKEKGFKYSDLIKIIPPAFETDYTQRRELLEDLVTWSIKEFGDYDIPF